MILFEVGGADREEPTYDDFGKFSKNKNAWKQENVGPCVGSKGGDVVGPGTNPYICQCPSLIIRQISWNFPSFSFIFLDISGSSAGVRVGGTYFYRAGGPPWPLGDPPGSATNFWHLTYPKIDKSENRRHECFEFRVSLRVSPSYDSHCACVETIRFPHSRLFLLATW